MDGLKTNTAKSNGFPNSGGFIRVYTQVPPEEWPAAGSVDKPSIVLGFY